MVRARKKVTPDVDMWYNISTMDMLEINVHTNGPTGGFVCFPAGMSMVTLWGFLCGWRVR